MQKDISFPAVMKCTAVITLILTVILALLYCGFPQDWIFAAAISTGTTFYHFAMRLLVGTLVPHCIRYPVNHSWFQQKSFEARLYEVLKVKHWKDRMPTYDPASFSLRENTLERIVYNSCVSEAVHEVIILFSFVPLLFALRWGAFPVFLITSFLAALFDSCFVIMQRYNRPRLIRILTKKEAKAHE